MKAALITRYGGREALELGDVETPVPDAHQLLVRVHSSSVNPIDWKLRSGQLRFVMPIRRPFVTGFDVAGVVLEVGAGVEKWKVGDRIIAGLKSGGGHAEFVAIDESLCVAAPPDASFHQCAALPSAGVSALQALRDVGRAENGKRVIINGASGGVGSCAVQIAKALGCHVTAVCSERNVGFVRELGADEVVDYSRQSPLSLGNFDLFFDVVPNQSFRACSGVLTRHGVYVTTLPGPAALAWKLVSTAGRVIGYRKRCGMLLLRPNADDLAFLVDLMNQGRLRTIVGDVFPLDEVRMACDQSEDGHARGKIVIEVTRDG